MDYKEKTRTEESNSAELNSAEENTTAKASVEERSHLTFRRGLRDGLPICLGYLSVAFTFGMVVVEGGLPPWVAVLISMTCFTGTGQFAGIALIVSGGMYVEMLVTTFIIFVIC